MMPYRVVFFMGALCLYAVFGSSTPDHPGWVEALVGGLLMFSAGLSHVFIAFRSREFWRKAAAVLLLYGICVPLLSGVLRGHDVGVIVRDLLAFVFVLLPLFFADLLRGYPVLLKVLVLLTGLCFSLRALLPVYGFYAPPAELLYLANSPLVLLTALLLLGAIIDDVFHRHVSLKTVLWAALLVFPLAAMLIDVQRAPVVVVCLSAFCMGAYVFFKRPMRGVVLCAVFVCVGVAGYSLWGQIAQEVMSKTSRVGMNMRVEEARAVLEVAGHSPISALFGLGWGATYAAPSVGGIHIAYTHSFLTYILLKTGFIGLLLGGVFCAAVLKHIVLLLRRRPFIGISVLWPFLIPLFLYASHKSLDFGVVLLFVFVFTAQSKGLRLERPSCRVLPKQELSSSATGQTV